MEPTMPPPPPPTGGGAPPPGYQAYNQYGAAPQYAGFGSRRSTYPTRRRVTSQRGRAGSSSSRVRRRAT